MAALPALVSRFHEELAGMVAKLMQSNEVLERDMTLTVAAVNSLRREFQSLKVQLAQSRDDLEPSKHKREALFKKKVASKQAALGETAEEEEDKAAAKSLHSEHNAAEVAATRCIAVETGAADEVIVQKEAQHYEAKRTEEETNAAESKPVKNISNECMLDITPLGKTGVLDPATPHRAAQACWFKLELLDWTQAGHLTSSKCRVQWSDDLLLYDDGNFKLARAQRERGKWHVYGPKLCLFWEGWPVTVFFSCPSPSSEFRSSCGSFVMRHNRTAPMWFRKCFHVDNPTETARGPTTEQMTELRNTLAKSSALEKAAEVSKSNEAQSSRVGTSAVEIASAKCIAAEAVAADGAISEKAVQQHEGAIDGAAKKVTNEKAPMEVALAETATVGRTVVKSTLDNEIASETIMNLKGTVEKGADQEASVHNLDALKMAPQTQQEKATTEQTNAKQIVARRSQDGDLALSNLVQIGSGRVMAVAAASEQKVVLNMSDQRNTDGESAEEDTISHKAQHHETAAKSLQAERAVAEIAAEKCRAAKPGLADKVVSPLREELRAQSPPTVRVGNEKGAMAVAVAEEASEEDIFVNSTISSKTQGKAAMTKAVREKGVKEVASAQNDVRLKVASNKRADGETTAEGVGAKKKHDEKLSLEDQAVEQVVANLIGSKAARKNAVANKPPLLRADEEDRTQFCVFGVYDSEQWAGDLLMYANGKFAFSDADCKCGEWHASNDKLVLVWELWPAELFVISCNSLLFRSACDGAILQRDTPPPHWFSKLFHVVSVADVAKPAASKETGVLEDADVEADIAEETAQEMAASNKAVALKAEAVQINNAGETAGEMAATKKTGALQDGIALNDVAGETAAQTTASKKAAALTNDVVQIERVGETAEETIASTKTAVLKDAVEEAAHVKTAAEQDGRALQNLVAWKAAEEGGADMEAAAEGAVAKHIEKEMQSAQRKNIKQVFDDCIFDTARLGNAGVLDKATQQRAAEVCVFTMEWRGWTHPKPISRPESRVQRKSDLFWWTHAKPILRPEFRVQWTSDLFLYENGEFHVRGARGKWCVFHDNLRLFWEDWPATVFISFCPPCKFTSACGNVVLQRRTEAPMWFRGSFHIVSSAEKVRGPAAAQKVQLKTTVEKRADGEPTAEGSKSSESQEDPAAANNSHVEDAPAEITATKSPVAEASAADEVISQKIAQEQECRTDGAAEVRAADENAVEEAAVAEKASEEENIAALKDEALQVDTAGETANKMAAAKKSRALKDAIAQHEVAGETAAETAASKKTAALKDVRTEMAGPAEETAASKKTAALKDVVEDATDEKTVAEQDRGADQKSASWKATDKERAFVGAAAEGVVAKQTEEETKAAERKHVRQDSNACVFDITQSGKTVVVNKALKEGQEGVTIEVATEVVLAAAPKPLAAERALMLQGCENSKVEKALDEETVAEDVATRRAHPEICEDIEGSVIAAVVVVETIATKDGTARERSLESDGEVEGQRSLNTAAHKTAYAEVGPSTADDLSMINTSPRSETCPKVEQPTDGMLDDLMQRCDGWTGVAPVTFYEVVYKRVAIRRNPSFNGFVCGLGMQGDVLAGKPYRVDNSEWLQVDIDRSKRFLRPDTSTAWALIDGSALGLPMLLKKTRLWPKAEIAKAVAQCDSILPDLPSSRERRIWAVVGGHEGGGILVRKGRSVASEACWVKLKHGTLIEQLEFAGNRLHYQRVHGGGPDFGWVSLQVNGKPLVVPFDDEQLDH